MDKQPDIKRMTPQEVAEKLTIYEPGMRGQPTWADIMKMYGGWGFGIGEIRSLDDWDDAHIPRERALRAVYLVDDRGPVIRWADTDNEEVCGVLGDKKHPSHYDLIRGDGTPGEVKGGYIRIGNDGQIFVQ